MSEHNTNPVELFSRLSLGTNGHTRSSAGRGQAHATSPPEELKTWVEQRGGVHLAFAEFLLWRVDLLGVDYVAALRQIDHAISPVSVESVAATLHRELGSDGDELARCMETVPAWSTWSRTAYRSRYKGDQIVVQVARKPVDESVLVSFEKDLRTLRHPAVPSVATPAVIAEFRQWLLQGQSCATERSYLELINRRPGETIADYPVLIGELATDNVLCWGWVEGEPVSSLVRQGKVEAVTQVAIAVLEQYCSLSVIDGEFSGDAMVITHARQRLAIRRINRPVAVPAHMVDIGMKYFAAVLEGNALLAAQTLANLAFGRPVANLERDLLGLMAASEPELKCDLWFPGSAAAFESNWRALTGLSPNRPLYLNFLHRNLMAVGYWTGEAVRAGGKAVDTISDAHWPVLERVFVANASRFLNPVAITEWSVSLGMLGLRSIREAGRVAEEVRDNNLIMEVELGERPTGFTSKAGHNVRVGLLIVCVFVLLLAIILYGGAVARSQGLAVAVASGLMLALFWSFARLR